ncbi:MAG: DUF3373 family protein [Elusimicrobia bacterium]|nr:DUF3373 family protein [Elusimicrobiota bacterium]
MKRTGRGWAGAVLAAALLALGGAARADDGGAQLPDWLRIGGDLQVRHDALMGKIPTYTQFKGTFTGANPDTTLVPSKTARNDSLLTDRLGLNLQVRPAEGVKIQTRLLMYKTFGMADAGATQAGYFADRQNKVFDGTLGHVPTGNTLYVDQAYATVSNLFDQPLFFSAGRRPSTGGTPANIRDDRPDSGGAGVPGLMIDYAFDGFALGFTPDIEKLPGFEAKVCYGRGYDSGYLATGSSPRDTNVVGVKLLAYQTSDSHVELQYARGIGIFDTFPGPDVKANLGDLEWWGGDVVRTFEGVGPGNLTGFLTGAVSVSHPSSNRYNAGFGANNPGLLCDGAACEQRTGYGVWLGERYDLTKTHTKLGAEYNYGTRYWTSFSPAADDMWTSKAGTRGHVFELYAIQEIPRFKLAPGGLVFFKAGWQYYAFNYTGSNGWVGQPQAIAGLTPSQMQFMAPVRSATDFYTTFEVRF